MKSKLLITLLLFISVLNSFSQDIIASGLKSFNLYINNPALTTAENKLQLDFMGEIKISNSSNPSSSGLFNAIFKLKKINSNIRFSYLRYGFSDIEKWNGALLGYSYSKDLSDNLNIAGGFDINYYSVDYSGFYLQSSIDNYSLDPNIPVKSSDLTDNHLHGILGLAGKYKELTIGVSSKLALWNDIGALSYAYKPNAKSGIQLFQINLIAKYEFKIKEKLTLTPQFEYLHHQNYNAEKDYKIGLFFNYNKLFGFGIMHDSYIDQLTNISAQVKLFKKVELIIVYNPTFGGNSTKEMNLYAQLRVNI